MANVGVYLAGELATSSGKGLYALRGFEPGEYTLLLATEDLPVGILAPIKSCIVHLYPGEETTWDWPLIRGSIIKGKLLLEGQRNKVAQGLLITIMENERIVARTLTDPAGNFQTPFLLPGSYRLVCEQLPDYELGTITVELGPGEERELDLLLKRKNKPLEQIFRTPEVQILEVR